MVLKIFSSTADYIFALMPLTALDNRFAAKRFPDGLANTFAAIYDEQQALFILQSPLDQFAEHLSNNDVVFRNALDDR